MYSASIKNVNFFFNHQGKNWSECKSKYVMKGLQIDTDPHLDIANISQLSRFIHCLIYIWNSRIIKNKKIKHYNNPNQIYRQRHLAARVNILTNNGEIKIREDDFQNIHSTIKVENQFFGWRISTSGFGFWFVRHHLVFIVALCPRTLSSNCGYPLFG